MCKAFSPQGVEGLGAISKQSHGSRPHEMELAPCLRCGKDLEAVGKEEWGYKRILVTKTGPEP